MLIACPGPLWALTAAGDGKGVWLLVPEPDQADSFNVLHYALSDQTGLMSHVQTLDGDIRPQSVSARGHRLWVIRANGQVQSIQAKPYILDDIWEYHNQAETSLPKDVAVRASTVTDAGLWVLVRVEDPDALSALDEQTSPSATESDDIAAKRRRNIALGLPPGTGIDTGDETTEPEPDESSDTPPADDPLPVDTATDQEPDESVTQPEAVSQPSVLPADRLLLLSRGRWYVQPLPEDWAHGSRAWLVAGHDSDTCPTLVALSPDSTSRDRTKIDVYRCDGEMDTHESAPQWSYQPYDLDSSVNANLAFVSAESQLVAARVRPDTQGVTAELSVLRSGKSLDIGTVSLPDAAPQAWSLLGTGNTATLLARTNAAFDAPPGEVESLAATWTRIDVRGRTVLEPTDLAVKARSPMDDAAQYIMLVFIALLVAMLMLAFWRRDADWNKLTLPDDQAVADLPRRAIAAAIDMAPGIVGAMLYFNLSFNDLMLRWPGNGIAHTLAQIAPGTCVIACFVLHTTLSELVFARTLGKALTGLRSRNLAGDRPKFWQLLVRGLLKTLDLIPGAWLLLLLPVITPQKQRLGDLIARTVITCDAPADSDSQSDTNESDKNERE